MQWKWPGQNGKIGLHPCILVFPSPQDPVKNLWLGLGKEEKEPEGQQQTEPRAEVPELGVPN